MGNISQEFRYKRGSTSWPRCYIAVHSFLTQCQIPALVSKSVCVQSAIGGNGNSPAGCQCHATQTGVVLDSIQQNGGSGPNRFPCCLFRGMFRVSCFNTLRPRQNGRHFADGMFKCIFLNENVSTPIEISLKFVPRGSINNNPALFQIMAWRRPGDKPLSEAKMVSSLTHICVTRPQWVNNDAFFYTWPTGREYGQHLCVPDVLETGVQGYHDDVITGKH